MPSKLILQSVASSSPPFFPTDVPGIYGWWSADYGVTESEGAVTQVLDRSGNGRTMANDAGTGPTRISLGGGLYAFVSSNINQYLQFVGGALTTNKLSIVACVGFPTSGSNRMSPIFSFGHPIENNLVGTWFGIQGNPPASDAGVPYYLMFQGNNGLSLSDFRSGADTGLTYADADTPIVCAMRADKDFAPSGKGDVAFNGVTISTATYGTNDLNASSYAILGAAEYNGAYYGQIREVVVYDNYVSDSDYAKLQTYLLNKYGVNS